MFLRRLLSHSLIYAVGPQIPKIAALFVLPLITPFLTGEDYGVYGVVTSYTGLFTGLADLGFSVVLVNSFFKYPVRWRIVWRQLHFYLVAWSGIYSVLIGILLYFVMPEKAASNRMYIILLICLPTLVFNSTIIIASRYYQFAQRPFYIAWTSAFVGVISIAINLYTIAYLHMGYMGWFLSTAIGSAIQFLFYFYPVFFKYKLAPLIAFRRNFLKKQLEVSLPVIPHNYSNYLLNSSDRIIMDNVGVKIGEIGKFNLAYTFGNYFEFFVNSVGMAVGPFYTKLIAKRSEKAEQDCLFITYWLQFSILVAGLLLSLWSKEMLDLLIRNDELKSVYPLTVIIIMGYAARPYYWAVVNRLQFNEQTKQLWKISFLAGILNVVLNLILIPFFGIMAAAITTFVALMYMGFAGFYLKSIDPSIRMRYNPLLVMIIVMASTAGVYFLVDISVYVKAGITLAILLIYFTYSWRKRTVMQALDI